MLSSEYREMTQKLNVSKRKLVPTPCGHCYRLESGFCLLLITQRKKQKISCPGDKQMAGMVFLSENQCDVLFPGLEIGGRWGGKLFSLPALLKLPFFPWWISFSWFQSLENSVLSRGPNTPLPTLTWAYCHHGHFLMYNSSNPQSSPNSLVSLLLSASLENQKS